MNKFLFVFRLKLGDWYILRILSYDQLFLLLHTVVRGSDHKRSDRRLVTVSIKGKKENLRKGRRFRSCYNLFNLNSKSIKCSFPPLKIIYTYNTRRYQKRLNCRTPCEDYFATAVWRKSPPVAQQGEMKEPISFVNSFCFLVCLLDSGHIKFFQI